VAELVMRLQAAARPDTQQLFDAELDQLLEDDRRAGAAHPCALDGDRLAFIRARVPEQAAFRVALPDVVEVRLRDVLRAQWVAGEEACFCILARLRTNVDRHGGQP